MPVGCIRSLTAAKEERERKKERKEGRKRNRKGFQRLDKNNRLESFFLFKSPSHVGRNYTHIYSRKVLSAQSLIRAKQDAA